MTKRNATKVGTSVLKWVAVATALFNLPELQAALGDNSAIAATGFAGASALKDTIVIVLDYLDDGKRNNSFSGLPLIALAAFSVLLLPSCTTDQGTATPVTATQAQIGGPITAVPLVPVDIGRAPRAGVLIVPVLDRSADEIELTPSK